MLAQDRAGPDGAPSPLMLALYGWEHTPGFIVIIKVRKNALFIERRKLEI